MVSLAKRRLGRTAVALCACFALPLAQGCTQNQETEAEKLYKGPAGTASQPGAPVKKELPANQAPPPATGVKDE